jgi:hypothetical protein
MELSLGSLVFSTLDTTPGTPYGYHALSHSNSTISTPSLDPSFPIATYYGAMLGNSLYVQTPRYFLVKFSMCLPTCSRSSLGRKLIRRCRFYFPWDLLCLEEMCSMLFHIFLFSTRTHCMWVISIPPMQ